MSGVDSDTIARRVRKLVLVAITFMLMIGIAGIASVLLSTRAVDKLARGTGPAADGIRDSLTAMLDADASIRGYIATGDASFLGRYHNAVASVEGDFDTALDALHLIGVHSYDARINLASTRAHAWRSPWAERVAGLNPSAAMATPVSSLQAGQKLFDSFRAAETAVIVGLNNDRVNLRAEALLFRNVGVGSLAITSVVLTGIALMLSLRTARGITAPIERLDDTVRRFEAGELAARAPEQGPRELQTLGRTVNAIAKRAQHEALVEQESKLLASRIQTLTIRIRRVDDPARIASLVTNGLGTAFECDRVWLHTFADERLPALTMQWHREGLAPLDASFGDDVDRAREAVDHLWQSGQPAVVDDHARYAPSANGSNTFFNLTGAGVRSSMSLPLGDAVSAFGLLTIGMVAHPREWTRAESATAHAFTADLAHALLQSSLIKRQREAVDQLEQLDRAKSTFVSNVSHELRAPLKSITGYVEMLQDGAAGPLPSEAVEMVNVIDRNAYRLRNLVEDLLTQSRIEAGRFHSSTRPVDLAKVLESAVAAMQPQIKASELTLQVNVPDEQMTVGGDEQHLEQVFSNVLANAIKFTRPGGTITLDAGVEADGVAVSITDTGIGIPRDELPSIFNRFFRGSNADEISRQGTGLGLAIVDEIVRQHGGEIGVESEVNAGSTFTVWLPSATEPEA